MNVFLSENLDYRLVAFYPAYENVHALLAEIYLYVFGQDGRLIESQPIRREKVVVALTGEELRQARIVIAPPLDKRDGEPVTLESVQKRHAFEIGMRFDDAQAAYQLPPVPESVWRWWLVHSLWKNVGKIA